MLCFPWNIKCHAGIDGGHTDLLFSSSLLCTFFFLYQVISMLLANNIFWCLQVHWKDVAHLKFQIEGYVWPEDQMHKSTWIMTLIS